MTITSFESIKNMHHVGILLFLTALFISGCTQSNEFKPETRNIHKHSIIDINNDEIYIPNYCKLSYLNHDDDIEFATISCESFVDNELHELSILDLRRNEEKESIVTQTMAQRRTINLHECGVILYPKISCYLKKTGVLISSDNIFVLEKFIEYQEADKNSQQQERE